MSYSDDHHGKAQTRDHNRINDPGLQNTILMLLLYLQIKLREEKRISTGNIMSLCGDLTFPVWYHIYDLNFQKIWIGKIKMIVFSSFVIFYRFLFYVFIKKMCFGWLKYVALWRFLIFVLGTSHIFWI